MRAGALHNCHESMYSVLGNISVPVFAFADYDLLDTLDSFVRTPVYPNTPASQLCRNVLLRLHSAFGKNCTHECLQFLPFFRNSACYQRHVAYWCVVETKV